jgi:hypothetical protein
LVIQSWSFGVWLLTGDRFRIYMERERGDGGWGRERGLGEGGCEGEGEG